MSLKCTLSAIADKLCDALGELTCPGTVCDWAITSSVAIGNPLLLPPAAGSAGFRFDSISVDGTVYTPASPIITNATDVSAIQDFLNASGLSWLTASVINGPNYELQIAGNGDAGSGLVLVHAEYSNGVVDNTGTTTQPTGTNCVVVEAPADINTNQSLSCIADDLLDKACQLVDELKCASCDFRIFYADNDSGGLWEPSYVHEASVNGVAVPNVAYDATAQANPVKSEAYVEVVAAVNALPGHSMTLETDFAIGAAEPPGKPSYIVTVPDGETLTITNDHTGDEIVLTAGAECSGQFLDAQGDVINSYQPEVV